MQVVSVQSSPNFNGLVSVRNRLTRLTKVYKTTPETDIALGKIYENIHKAKTLDSGINQIKLYLAKIFEETKDKFITELPPVGEVYQDGLLSARSGYATYRGGENYSELKTDGYEIIHDLAK